MAGLFKPGTIIQGYKIVELAGDGSQSNVYLAEREQTFYWLIQIESPNWGSDVRAAQVQQFETEGAEWVAFTASGIRMVDLASWVDKMELPFIGWRWAQLARTVGFIHDKNVVLQRTRPLSLERLVFNNEGELLVSQTDRDAADEYTFAAPDNVRALTPAADVYALGASLKALAGENLPRAVEKVLQRAMDPDAAKRYRNGKEFGEALAQVLPNPAREKVIMPRPHSAWRWIAFAGAFLCGGVALVIGLVIWFGLLPNPIAEPTAVAVQEIPLRVTILKWSVQEPCDARVAVRAEEAGFVVTTNEGVEFYASTPLATITQINLSPGENPGEYLMTFGMGDFCKKGGALTIYARRENKQGQSIVYYYPEAEAPKNFALYKSGGRQANVRSYPKMRLYFGLTDHNGGPAALGGPIIVKLYQDGQGVPKFSLKPVDLKLDPLIAVLVLDTSKSMVGEPLAHAQQAAVSFIEQLDPNDFVCVYRFSTQVQEVHICSADHAAAINAINKLTAGGNTALYDVLVRVAGLHGGKSERQAIIVLSDGADNNSKATREQALAEIQRTNVPVYPIGLVNQDYSPQVLQEIAAKTGGVYLEAPTSNELIGLYDRLGKSLARQYQVDFESIFPERKKGTIELVISDGKDEIKIQRDFVVEQ